MRVLSYRPLTTMGGYVEFSVYLACLTFVLNFYVSLVILLGMMGHLLMFLIVSCALFGVLLRFRIPRPKEATHRNIFGSDWGAYKSLSEDKKIDNPDTDYVMKVVAHRSCGLDAPENSLSAIEKVNKEGITAVEFDVLLTSDCVPVVFHDTNLSRMTDDCRNISDMTFNEVRKLDISAKHPFGKLYMNEKIPTLEEYIMFCLNNNIRMFIDLKDGQRNTIQIINNLYKQHPKLYDFAVVSSFNPVLIYKIRNKDPKIACSLAWRPYFYSHEDYSVRLGPSQARTTNLMYLLCLRVLNHIHQWALWRFGYYVLGLSALLLHKDMVTRDIINYWTKRGIRVIAWSVNLPTEKQYFEKILEITYLTDTVIRS